MTLVSDSILWGVTHSNNNNNLLGNGACFLDTDAELLSLLNLDLCVHERNTDLSPAGWGSQGQAEQTHHTAGPPWRHLHSCHRKQAVSKLIFRIFLKPTAFKTGSSGRVKNVLFQSVIKESIKFFLYIWQDSRNSSSSKWHLSLPHWCIAPSPSYLWTLFLQDTNQLYGRCWKIKQPG